MERKKTIYIFIIAVAFCIIFNLWIGNAKRANEYRRLCNQYTKQLNATEEANRELTVRIGRIAEITGKLKKTTDANITDARGIIETVEILRTQIKELEDCCGGFDYNDYYEHYDSYYRNEGLME